jgi:hypothetical protein
VDELILMATRQDRHGGGPDFNGYGFIA